jgi:UDP-N-acetylmuramate--alanine ligase
MRIYFSGIGGVGVGPLAEIALDAGYGVAGSDLAEGLMTQQLSARKVPLAFNQSGDFLRDEHAKDPFDWFVYTAALPDNHTELVVARELGIKTAKRDELLAHIIAEKNLKLIAVAGTHGKTTTTGMLVWALQQLDVPVSYSVGTTLSWGPSGKFNPESEYFVYECDEFDRNFLHFSPYLSLITTIEYDHPDTYASEREYFDAFMQFEQQSEQSILWQEDATAANINDPRAWCLQPGEVMNLQLAGEHNRRNATLVYKALERLGLGTPEKNATALETFLGTNRRFEKLATNLYSDYGHTPTEIAATLQMADELAERIVLVYQPHQNIRQHEIYSQYTDEVFEKADAIYWLPTYQSREDPSLEILTPQQLTKNLNRKKPLMFCTLNDELWSHIQIELHKGKLVLCMGAGSIDEWLRKHTPQNIS